jgi:hypothetical protein
VATDGMALISFLDETNQDLNVVHLSHRGIRGHRAR